MSICTLSKVPEQIQAYFNSQNTQALAKSTQQLYSGVARKKLIPFCDEKGILHLDKTFENHMDDYAVFIRQRTSAQTVAEYLTISKIFFRFHGHEIKHTYKIPRADKQAFDLKHEKRWFTEEHIAMCRTYIFPVLHNRNHLLVRLMIETGARVNEIAHIKVGDIRVKDKTILLSHSKTIPRPVFFSQETAIFMQKHLQENFPDTETNYGDLIFPSKNMIYKIINGMLKDLGLKKKGDGRGPHTFRHYTATHLRYNLKMDLDHVARLLGDTPETISTRYLHPTAEMLQSLMNKASGW